MANIVTNEFKKELAVDNISLSADNFLVALVTSAITLSAADEIRETINWSQLSGVEVVGSGYTAGGQLLSNSTVTKDSTNNRGVWDADSLSWTNSTLNDVRGAVIYLSGYTPVVGFVDFGNNNDTSNATFNLNWNSSGILNIN